MSAIEKVTSKTKLVTNKETGALVTITVWNATVANLTLMALGSSAPEILLSVIELIGGSWYSGALGPSTIVGSAAFNLLMIIAVCVYSIPDGEVRYVKETAVFAVTAGCSMFAYAWLVVILVIVTPDAIDVGEGVLTFIFFPILVVVAYLADRGYFSKGQPLTPTEKAIEKCPSRAQRRMEALQMLTANRRNPLTNASSSGSLTGLVAFQFTSPGYSVLFGSGAAFLTVERIGDESKSVLVEYKTSPETAEPGKDYEESSGILLFAVGETQKVIAIPLPPCAQPEGAAGDPPQAEAEKAESPTDDNEASKTEDAEAPAVPAQEAPPAASPTTDSERILSFKVDLANPAIVAEPSDKADEGEAPADPGCVKLASCSSSFVTLVAAEGPGVLDFEQSQITLPGPKQDKQVMLVIHRSSGYSGEVKCKYRTQAITAMPGRDFIETNGELVFGAGETLKLIEVTIVAKHLYEATDSFRVVLEDLEGGATFNTASDGGGSSCIATVTVKPREDAGGSYVAFLKMLDQCFNLDEMSAATEDWKRQFSSAVYVNGSAEEQQNSSMSDVVLHVLACPWKIVFAAIPPTGFFGGWLCFCVAIGAIGVVTAIVGDMASLFGCCAGLNDSITAITFVALGTSLPDTFASRMAALQDEYADNSLGNVTGSNSVNVFLGLGLPWMMGSIFWASAGPTEEWKARYPELSKTYAGGAFIVKAGDLGFSVTAFLVTSALCIGTLVVRRRMLGGELGGSAFVKAATAGFFSLLWAYYVAVSSWKVIAGDVEGSKQILAIVLGLIIVFVIFGIGAGVGKAMSPRGPESVESE
eukprot:TRINITY_DN2612_c0_g1_i2.p1 TRINITY_DN2612_c0_g1~~TRINITY_DN2612_c0_g1_i2.p1  ORF type:complete len:889 (+),score=192.71 TRINITY_DN2612_c0_g1_i2:226-2667(+)